MKRFVALLMALLLMGTSALAAETVAGLEVKPTLAEMGFTQEELAALLPPDIEVTMDDNRITFADNSFSNIDIQPPFVKGTLNNGVWTIEIPEGEDLSETRIEAWPKGGNYYAFSLDGELFHTLTKYKETTIQYSEGSWTLDPINQDANYYTATYDAQGELVEYKYRSKLMVEGQPLIAEVYYKADGNIQMVLLYNGLQVVYFCDVWKKTLYWSDGMGAECSAPGDLADLSYEGLLDYFPPLCVVEPEPASVE